MGCAAAWWVRNGKVGSHMFARRRSREDLFEKTLQEFLRVFPNADEVDSLRYWPSDLRFLLELERRKRMTNDRVKLSEEERNDLQIICGHSYGWFSTPGPLGGFAMHDCPDAVLHGLLGDAEHAARKLAKELGVAPSLLRRIADWI